MFPCPHCGKTIEVEPRLLGPRRQTPWRQFESGGGVSLGCGTLILIAIIVAIFSSTGDDSDAIRELRQEIQQLETKIDKLQGAPQVPN